MRIDVSRSIPVIRLVFVQSPAVMLTHQKSIERSERPIIYPILRSQPTSAAPYPRHIPIPQEKLTTRIPIYRIASSDPLPNSPPPFLSRHIRLPSRTQPGPADQKVVGSHKVRVASDAISRVQPGQNLIDKVGLAAGPDIAELGDPDGLAVGLGDGLPDMVFKVRDRHRDAVAGAAVPVDVEEVDLAAGALLHEVAEPGQAGGGAGVGDGRGAEFGGPAGKLLHVCVPAGDGVGRGEGGAAIIEAHVGFVETEEVAGSGGDGGGGSRGPAFGVVA